MFRIELCAFVYGRGGGGVMFLVTWQQGEKEENEIVPMFGQFESSTHVKKCCMGSFLGGKTSNLNTFFTIHRQ